MSPQKGKKDKPRTKKLTLSPSDELHFRLENLAMLNGSHKAAFALRLIDQGLKSYRADAGLKNLYAAISGQPGEAA
jgi:hypothetical protein